MTPTRLPRAVLLDTSVLIRFFHDHRDPPQVGADLLRDAFAEGDLQAVLLDLSVYELINVLVRRLHRSGPDLERDVDALFELGIPIYAIEHELARRAATVASETDLSGYDAAFVAAAQSLALTLVTADRTIVERAGAHDVIDLAALV